MTTYPEAIPLGIPVATAVEQMHGKQPQMQKDALSFLAARGYPAGLAEEMLTSISKVPMRVWVVDDSGSMMAGDGQIVKNGKIIKCTRAKELAETVKAQAALAAALGTRCDFQFLNGPCFTVDGATVDKATVDAQLAALHGDLGPDGVTRGGTPLTESVRKVIKRIAPKAESLRAAGQRALVVLVTDGHPNNPKTFLDAMRSLQELPVLVTVRLCTSEESVTDYWTSLDKDLERPLDCLDDVAGEAAECAKTNPWLVYGAPLQEAREFGMTHKLFDLLDEAALLPTQARALLALLFGGALRTEAAFPEPESDWPGFERAALDAAAAAGLAFDCGSRQLRQWVDSSRLAECLGPRLRLRLRGEKLKKVDMFSESDPFVLIHDAGEGAGTTPLGQTEKLNNQPNPCWAELTVAYPRVPSPKARAALRFSVYSGSAHKLIGTAEAFVDEILAGKMGRLELAKDGKKGGRGWLVIDG